MHFYDTFNSFRIKIDYYKKISCIHLRNEKDANAFWAIINKMVHSEYVEKLNNKYIYLINKYLNPSPDEILLILSSETTNDTINNYLTSNGYNYMYLPKHIYREIGAINDLFASRLCNNVFIGGYNPQTLTGSTFSYVVSNTMENEIKRVLIDLDHIKNDEFCL